MPDRISIKRPDGTVITIEGERAVADILPLIKEVLSPEGDELTSNNSGTSQELHELSGAKGLDDLSKIDKIKILIKNAMHLRWFSSHDLQELYHHYFGSVPISTVSTYLARLVESGDLEKQGPRQERRYKLIENALLDTPDFNLSQISVFTPTT